MNLFHACYPPMPGNEALMHIDEARALDLIMHMVQPELVVDCGTNKGGSAAIFARHARVITIDKAPHPSAAASFIGKPITQVIGESPGILNTIEHMLSRRWMYFHDSHHVKDLLMAEVTWAFDHGAVAAVWHDVAWADMLDAMPLLRMNGHLPFRMMELPDKDGHMTQGLGFCWNGRR